MGCLTVCKPVTRGTTKKGKQKNIKMGSRGTFTEAEGIYNPSFSAN
jgi:hypothetical protein